MRLFHSRRFTYTCGRRPVAPAMTRRVAVSGRSEVNHSTAVWYTAYVATLSLPRRRRERRSVVRWPTPARDCAGLAGRGRPGGWNEPGERLRPW